MSWTKEVILNSKCYTIYRDIWKGYKMNLGSLPRNFHPLWFAKPFHKLTVRSIQNALQFQVDKWSSIDHLDFVQNLLKSMISCITEISDSSICHHMTNLFLILFSLISYPVPPSYWQDHLKILSKQWTIQEMLINSQTI